MGLLIEEEATQPPFSPPIDVGQLYQEWAALNPNATPADIFAAGRESMMIGNTPVGTGVEDFAGMPYDPSMQPDAISQVDSFAEISGVDDFTGVPTGPVVGGELGPGFNSPGFVPGGLPGTGVDPNAGIAPQRQRGAPIDMSEFGVRRGGPGG